LPDVFLSYNRDDQAAARRFAEAFQAQGLDVWWDATLRSGEAYDEVTEKALRDAKAVVVLWSTKSVVSRWVRAEATLAHRNKTLLPVMIEACERPIMFELTQTAELAHWQGDARDDAWVSFVADLRKFVEIRAEGPVVNAPAAASPRDSRPAILVLPFSNMSGDPEQEYFSDGISEDIITDLSKVSALSVISRNTAFSYKGKHVDLAQVARQLKVSHVLEGSVRKSGNRVRITAQLIDGKNDDHVWAERYDRDLSDIFALQDEISEAIVGALKLRLLPDEKKAIEARGTTNPEAYKLFLMARQYLFTGSERHRPLIIRLCQRALDIDPSYAPAWALLAIGQSNIRLLSGGTGDNGWDAANRALALDPNLADAHAAKGRILADQGHYDEAVGEHEIAVRLDPQSYEVNCAAARCYTAMRRYDEAILHYETATALNDSDFWACGMAIQCYEANGDLEGMKRIARHTLERVERMVAAEPDHTLAMGWGVTAFVALGEKERAKVWTESALLLAPPDDLNLRYNLACNMATLGDADRALDLLEPVIAKSQIENFPWIKIDTSLDNIREHPRFKAMIAAAEARLAQAKDDFPASPNPA